MVWDVESGQRRHTLEGHTGGVESVALSADGKTAVSGSWDKTVMVWDVVADQSRKTPDGVLHGLICRFKFSGTIMSVALMRSPDCSLPRVVCGDDGGSVHFMTLCM